MLKYKQRVTRVQVAHEGNKCALLMFVQDHAHVNVAPLRANSSETTPSRAKKKEREKDIDGTSRHAIFLSVSREYGGERRNCCNESVRSMDLASKSR